jgi:replicative DNA helicase
MLKEQSKIMSSRNQKALPAPVKAPPFNREAEQALLGAAFVNPAIIPAMMDKLTPETFYSEVHQHIATALFNLKDKTDPVTVQQWLADKGLLEKCGGQKYLAELSDCVFTSAGWETHADIVKKLAVRYRLIELCKSTIEACHREARFDLEEEALTELKTGIRDIEVQRQTGYKTNFQLVNEVFNDVEKRSREGIKLIGPPTGLKNIDTKTHGLEPETTIYLAARPSIGKTALALNIADNLGLDGHRVLFFALESSAVALTRRRMACYSTVFLWRLRTGEIQESQWSLLIETSNTLSADYPKIIDNPKYKTVENLTAFAESEAMNGPISLIVIDHIQLATSNNRRLDNRSRHQELSYVSQEYQSLAKRLHTTVLVTCQLSRQIEMRPKDRQQPQLSDMKESGDLEQNADQVWALWRKDKESEDVRLECLKGRESGTFVTWLKFDKWTQRFNDADLSQAQFWESE